MEHISTLLGSYRSRETCAFDPYPRGSIAKISGCNPLTDYPFRLALIEDYHSSNGIFSLLLSQARSSAYRRSGLPGADSFDRLKKIWTGLASRYYPTPPILKAIGAIRSTIPEEYQDLVSLPVEIDKRAVGALRKVYKANKRYFDLLDEPAYIYRINEATVASLDMGEAAYPNVESYRAISDALANDPSRYSYVKATTSGDYYISAKDPYLSPIYREDWIRLGLQPKFEVGSLVRISPDRDRDIQQFIRNYPRDDEYYYYGTEDYWLGSAKRMADCLRNDFYRISVVDRRFISRGNDIDFFCNDNEYPILCPSLFAAAQPDANGLAFSEVYGRWYNLVKVELPGAGQSSFCLWAEERQLTPDFLSLDGANLSFPEVPYRIGSYVAYRANTATRLANTVFPESYLHGLGIDPKEIFKNGLGVVVGYLYPYGEKDFRSIVWGEPIYEDPRTCELIPFWDEMESGDGWQEGTASKCSFWMFFDPEREFIECRSNQQRNGRPEWMAVISVLHPDTLNPAFLAYVPTRYIIREIDPSSVAWLLKRLKPDFAALESLGIASQLPGAGRSELLPPKDNFEIL